MVYNYTGRYHLIENAADIRVTHTGRLILDYDTGQGYRVDTYKHGPTRYIRVSTVNDLAYFRVVGPRNYFTGIRSPIEIGIGKESVIDLGGGLFAPLPRTFNTTITSLGGDDLNASFATVATTYKFDSRATITANLALYDALFVTYVLHQHYLELGYVDLTPQ